MGLLHDLLGGAGVAQAATSNNPGWQQVSWQPQQPGQLAPAITTSPLMYPQAIPTSYARPVLSDFDIELMAACIANHHPVVDGHTHCFCTLKRLERGISKD